MPRVLPEYKRQARARIAAAGLSIFLRKGYRRTSMDDIAKEIGVSKGDLYLYYPSKVAILKEVQLASRREARSSMAHALEAGNAVDGLVGVVDQAVADLGDPRLWAMWLELMVEADSDAELRKMIRIDHREDVRMVKALLRHEKVAPSIRRSSDPDDLALAILILFYGAALQLSLGSPWPKTRRALREGIRALLGG
jgi:AcrR family transcriptional regulator